MKCITVLHGIRPCLFPSCSQVLNSIAISAWLGFVDLGRGGFGRFLISRALFQLLLRALLLLHALFLQALHFLLAFLKRNCHTASLRSKIPSFIPSALNN